MRLQTAGAPGVERVLASADVGQAELQVGAETFFWICLF